MRTLNDIPDYLKEPQDDDWTPRRGVIKGLLGASVAGPILALIVAAITRYFPLLTGHWALSFAWAFFCTWILFAVVYRCSGMVGWPCILIVVSWMILVVCARQIGWYLHVASIAPAQVALRDFLHPQVMVFFNPGAWIGIGAMAFFCRDGDDCIHEIVDLAMTNPFIGGRV